MVNPRANQFFLCLCFFLLQVDGSQFPRKSFMLHNPSATNNPMKDPVFGIIERIGLFLEHQTTQIYGESSRCSRFHG
jgi:hypothetical protein